MYSCNRTGSAFVIAIILLLAGCGGGGSSAPSPTNPGVPGGGGGVVSQESAPHAPVRTRYLRTDAFYDPNSLQFAPPRFTVYDPLHKRFFVSNPFINLIDVFDAVQEVQIGKISVPGAWGLDVSADGTTLYAGTLIGDLYKIDTGQLSVLQKIPVAAIGNAGFATVQPFVLADGRLALVGALGGLTVDGSSFFAVWNPVDNSINVLGGFFTPVCGIFNIGPFVVSGDRTRILFGSIDSDGTLCSFDPATNIATRGQFDSFGTFVNQILPMPDGKRFFAWGQVGVIQVFDAATVQPLGTIHGPVPNSIPSFTGGVQGGILSRDGATLFIVDGIADMFAYDTATLASKGWVANYQIPDSQDTIVPGAADETGLIAGPIGHGVAFIDGSQIHPGSQPPQIGLGFVAPATGPVSGGTQVQVGTSSGVQNLDIFPALSKAFIGDAQLQQQTTFRQSPLFFPTIQGTTVAAKSGGAADFTAVFANGDVAIMPESFSYGPVIIQVVPNAATADGGSTGALIGYGLGATANDVKISVGGQPATVKAFFPGPPIIPYPFPIQGVQFTIPPGAAGSAVDVTVTTAGGSTTAAGAVRYIETPVTFAVPAGAALNAGIYDPHRNLYYFTDLANIQVLSPTTGFQAPITLPNTGAATQLIGLGLSPDGTKLAVADFGDKKIYVLNPDSPASAQEFFLPQVAFTLGTAPVGLAMTNAGVVYFATADTAGTGDWAFHKVDSNTGVFTDFTQAQDGGLNDLFIRVLQSPNGFIYSQIQGGVFRVDPATDKLTNATAINDGSGGNLELALSADGSTLSTNGFLADAAMNPISTQSYIDRETFFPTGAEGQKLSKDGSVLFQPLTDGIDIVSTRTGRLEWRVALNGSLPDIYDTLVVNGIDNTVLVIQAQNVMLVNLNQLAQLPAPNAQTAFSESEAKHTQVSAPVQERSTGRHKLSRLQLKRKAIHLSQAGTPK